MLLLENTSRVLAQRVDALRVGVNFLEVVDDAAAHIDTTLHVGNDPLALLVDPDDRL